MDRDITMKILELAVTIVALVITRYVIPYLKAKTENERFDKAVKAVCEAVKAAEQIFGEKDGETKKRYVMSYTLKLLGNAGVKMSEQELETLIEAAVHTMNSNDAVVNILPELVSSEEEETEDEPPDQEDGEPQEFDEEY